jgi:hypothetical protein
MATCSSDADAGAESAAPNDAVLALNHDKSPSCPTPRENRAYLLATGEILPIACGRNDCGYCRPRNVQITASMMGISAARSDNPPTYAVLSTTRDWVDEATLRNGWKDMARRVRREVEPTAGYAWFREWTTGKSDGIRRTHYHSTWTSIRDDQQAKAVADVSNDVWKRLAGAWSEKAHGYKRIYDAGGLARYIAGLAGHHLKSEQAPPPGWSGRRVGTSRGFYSMDARELRREAMTAVRDERLVHHLERTMAEDDGLPDGLTIDIWDDVLTGLLEEARARPKPTVIRVRDGFWK